MTTLIAVSSESGRSKVLRVLHAFLCDLCEPIDYIIGGSRRTQREDTKDELQTKYVLNG